MPQLPVFDYVPTRCQAFFAVWVVQNTFLGAPAGWICQYVSAGVYRIKPAAADIPDLRKSIAVGCINWIDLGTEVFAPPSLARTFVIVTSIDYYEITIVDSSSQAGVDAPFALMVLAPG